MEGASLYKVVNPKEIKADRMIEGGRCDDVRVVSCAPAGEIGRKLGLWNLVVENPGWPKVVPGQFAMLRPERFGLSPLWARPFSICRATDEAVSFFFQVVGRGTKAMTGLVKGETVAMWGPLGKGFAVEPGVPTLLLAGGMGLAPFAEYIMSHPTPETLHLVFGHRPEIECYPFNDLAARVRAENHWEQKPGDLEAFLATLDARVKEYAEGLVLACGPKPFLVAAARLGAKYGARTQVSLENRMACGVGACLGCVEEDARGHYAQVCKRGPVFWAKDLKLAEAGK